ncbi:MAG: AAA family ATPase [Gammaproteobacteria bacterium]|nr:AAA family ATPase [Gammaproteobacteria bacterium]
MANITDNLPGFDLREALHLSDTSSVYRAVRHADGRAVIVKRSVGASLSPRQLIRYRNEFELLRELDSRSVVKALDLIRHDGHVALILEEHPGTSLKHWMCSTEAPLEERLEVAAQLAALLADVHAAGVIHKDVNPHNVLYDPLGRVSKLIDFGIATRLRNEDGSFKGLSALEGTLAYMAPEQTGRMNRLLDSRADLYSLGVTYYELFTGVLPIDNADPLEIIHFHIAGTPVAPHERNRELPRPLSDLIMKLLQKAPERRYQSAAGVEADLRRCLLELRRNGEVAPFELGRGDRLERFEVPHRLYGRDEESQALTDAFERVASGGVEAVLITGPAGIGKSALVQQLHEPITRRRGYFAAGRFDPLRRNVPLSGLVSALQDLVQQLLTESDESIASWRGAIQEAVGTNGRIIVELVPAVELVIGPQPPLREVDPAEARNRFNAAFQRFVQVFGRKDHPLVLFLDDVQWADPASLALIGLILAGRDTESLLLVQAYREGDVNPGHPLSIAIEDLRERGVPTVDVALAALEPYDIAEIVADTLRQERAESDALARVIAGKTGGNPFFVRQFLQMLHSDGLIRFDAAANAFSYDVRRIESAAATENVVELLSAKLDKLPAETRRVLELAAAIGYVFDLDTLAGIYDAPPGTAASHLRPALVEGLIVPMSELESVEPGNLDAPLVYRRYSFLHDRVRQVAYDAIAEADRPALHLALGRALLTSSPSAVEARLFDVVNHMNLGAGLIEDAAERLRLVELNGAAGARAKASTAYAMAVRCYGQAVELLGDAGWTEHYALCFDAHLRLAECLWMKADYAAAFSVIDRAVARSVSDTDKARLYTVRTAVHLGTGDMPAALDCGRSAARLVAVDLPDSDDAVEAMLQREMEAILRRTSEIGVEKLLDLPRMEDADRIAAMALLTHCLPAAFQSNQQLFALICCKMVTLSLDHGNCSLSARAYGSFAALLSSAFGNYRDAHRFAKLAVELCRRLEDFGVLSAAYFLWAMFASHWNEPVDRSIELFRHSISYGLQTGDHLHAGYSAARRLMHLQYRGVPLDELRRQADEANELLERIGDAANLEYLPPRLAVIKWLQGERPAGNELRVGDLDEAAATAAIAARGNRSFESDWHTLLLMQRYFAGDYEAAYACSRRSEELLPFSAGFCSRVEHELYSALTFAALVAEADEERGAELRRRVDQSAKRFDEWAELCPENFSHMQQLIRAERARLDGRWHDAMHCYDRAIAAASDHGFASIEAVAAEAAARFWFDEGKADFGNIYLQKALHAYEIWGAHGKAADLTIRRRGGVLRTTITAQTTASTGTSVDRAGALDLATLLKANQAIAGEIVLDRLLGTLLDIIVENAGAEAGALVLESDGQFLVQARKDSTGALAVLENMPLNRCGMLSPGIVYYVIRTKEHVVLADPAESGHFRNDAYVRDARPRSVLCAPVLHKGELTGVLYLENNQVSGAFTPDRLEALNILLSQIAVSIDNAQLYAAQQRQKRDMERANVELTREVGERKKAEREIRRYRDHLEDLVRERTAELEAAQGRLVDLSRRAGMAEVAAGVLHNVGNVMNSVNVGASVARDGIKALPVERLAAVCDLLDSHRSSLGAYLTDDPSGRKVPDYLRKLADALSQDKDSILVKIDHVLEHLEHMKKIIGAQQTYAKTNGVAEVCRLTEIAETALSISEAALRNSSIEIVREYEELPPVSVDRHQIMQILVNLISNAKHALEASDNAERRIVIRIAADAEEGIRLEVEDNGIGIPAGNLTKIFSHGFTTKPKGHGFGLHNCANGAQQMKGSLAAYSEGDGRGARFVLRIPADYATHPVPRLERPGGPGSEAAAG